MVLITVVLIGGFDLEGKSYIRDILLVHDFRSVGAPERLRIIVGQIEELSDGCVNGRLTITRTWERDGIYDSIQGTKSEFSRYWKSAGRGDMYLFLVVATNPDADAVLVKTKSGWIFVGPNDGHLGFLSQDDIIELRKITKPEFHGEFSRRIHAAAALARGIPLDDFSVEVAKDELVVC